MLNGRPVVAGDDRQEIHANFPALQLFTIDETFGGWTEAQAKHFDDRGVFDQVATAKR